MNPQQHKRLVTAWRQWLDNTPVPAPEELASSLADRLPARTPFHRRVVRLAVAASLLLCCLLLISRQYTYTSRHHPHTAGPQLGTATPTTTDGHCFDLPHEDFVLVCTQGDPIYVALPNRRLGLRRQQ
jgi:hypothetical protein